MKSPRNYTGLRDACSVRTVGGVGDAAAGNYTPFGVLPQKVLTSIRLLGWIVSAP